MCIRDSLKAGVTYCQAAPVLKRIVQALWEVQEENIRITFLQLSSSKYCQLLLPATLRLSDVEAQCTAALNLPLEAVVLPHGERLRLAILRNPTETLQELMETSKQGQSM